MQLAIVDRHDCFGKEQDGILQPLSRSPYASARFIFSPALKPSHSFGTSPAHRYHCVGALTGLFFCPVHWADKFPIIVFVPRNFDNRTKEKGH